MNKPSVVIAAALSIAGWTACVGDDPVTTGDGAPATGDGLGAL